MSPYSSWKERTNQTQNDVYVRDLLNTDEFLLDENRINLGPQYNYRKPITPQSPMSYGTPDMWGWANWSKKSDAPTTPTVRNPELYTQEPPRVFLPCSMCKRPRKYSTNY